MLWSCVCTCIYSGHARASELLCAIFVECMLSAHCAMHERTLRVLFTLYVTGLYCWPVARAPVGWGARTHQFLMFSHRVNLRIAALIEIRTRDRRGLSLRCMPCMHFLVFANVANVAYVAGALIYLHAFHNAISIQMLSYYDIIRWSV